MSQSVHLVANNVPAYVLPEGQCFLSPGVSGKAVALNPSSSRCQLGFHSQVKIGPLKYASRSSYACKATSGGGGYRRNPDFSKQNRHGFSRGRNRQNEERDSYEHLEESDILSSKNGPFLSLSNTPKFQATAAPGPREKEIVELFRKVQAQLRERAAAKEEKKTEAVQGQGKENETVDSLLKLLRKHSAEQAKRNSSTGNNKEFMLDQQEQNGQFSRRSVGSFDSNNVVKDDAQDSIPSFTRPVSKFQRKSPVPRMKYQSVYSDVDAVNSVPHLNSREQRQKDHVETLPKSDAELELEEEPEQYAEESELVHGELVAEHEPELVQLLGDDLSSTDEVHNEDDVDEIEDEQQLTEHADLSAWKLPELRALAKSRGVKGYSKMKKAELVDLLSGSSVDS
ncbi:hypothetical protein UlMin_031663 [Ulmus minor]